MESYQIQSFLMGLMAELPLLAIYGIGCIVGFMKMKDSPTKAKVVIGVMVLFLVDFVFSTFFYTFAMPSLWDSMGETARYLSTGVRFLRACFQALLFSALLWSVFSKPKKT